MALFFPFDILAIFHKLFESFNHLGILRICPVTVNGGLDRGITFKLRFFEVVLFPCNPIGGGADSFGLEGALLDFLVLFLIL